MTEHLVSEEVTITVRVPKDLAQQVREVAISRDETTSQVIRRSLRRYVGGSPKQANSEGIV